MAFLKKAVFVRNDLLSDSRVQNNTTPAFADPNRNWTLCRVTSDITQQQINELNALPGIEFIERGSKSDAERLVQFFQDCGVEIELAISWAVAMVLPASLEGKTFSYRYDLNDGFTLLRQDI